MIYDFFLYTEILLIFMY